MNHRGAEDTEKDREKKNGTTDERRWTQIKKVDRIIMIEKRESRIQK